MKVSIMAENLIGSEIINLAGQVNELKKQGQDICNLTIGDFDPKYFPIPDELLEEITNSYRAGNTNYPAANGMLETREAVSTYIKNRGSLDYPPEEILISAGSRPLIFASYMTIVDKGDKVVFPLPSWNNNHYSHLTGAEAVMVETTRENNFMPTVADLAPHLEEAALLALCSPLNPTGTVFSENDLSEICDLVLEINSRKAPDQKPLYMMYDQVYWQLTYGDTKHYDPVSLRPEMREYTVYVDGISKAYAATGVRLGWSFGPAHLINKMRPILSHVGAWSPKAEQIATAKFLLKEDKVDEFLGNFKTKIQDRLDALYNGISLLKADGFPVDAIAPMAAIYLTVQLDLCGSKTADGTVLESTRDVFKYILEEAQIAVVPFFAFGASETNSWYRLSVGSTTVEEIHAAFERLRTALESLTLKNTDAEVSLSSS